MFYKWGGSDILSIFTFNLSVLCTTRNQSCSQLHMGHTAKGAPPTDGGDEEPIWPWEEPVWSAEMAAAAPLAMGGAISANSGDDTSSSIVLHITSCHPPPPVQYQNEKWQRANQNCCSIMFPSQRASDWLRYALKKKTISFGNFSQQGGGVFPNPKTFVNLPSIFLYAKFILRC